MPTDNDFGPAVMAHDAAMIRNALVRRVVYAIADTENPADFVANTSGQVTIGLAYNGVIFWLDPNDTTSAHDGVSVIVTSDGYRYLTSDIVAPASVMGVDVNDPPTGSAIGDAYLTSAAPTGDWAGFPEFIAVWTSRGWAFVEPQVGRLYYVTDGSSRWVFLDENGDIVPRFEAQPSSIADSALIGGQRRYIVESQTLNVPPVSPGLGIYWIIGPAPTGAWAGEAGNIATSYDGANWTIIPAVFGLSAFDRDSERGYIFVTGEGWIGDGARYQTFDVSDTWTKPPSGSRATFMLWGGGGSGGSRTAGGSASGGGGGAFAWYDVPFDVLPASLSVVVGNGGASVSGNLNGNAGQNTTVSWGALTIMSASGGAGGSNNLLPNNVSGGTGGSNSVPGDAGAGVEGTIDIRGSQQGSNGGGASAGGGPTAGGPSRQAGGGGGAARGGTGAAGGVSQVGGSGGSGVGGGPGQAGQRPGGGGGAGEGTGGASGAGGAGRVIVIVF